MRDERDWEAGPFPAAVRQVMVRAGFYNTDHLAYATDERLAHIGLSAGQIRRIRAVQPFRDPGLCPYCGGSGKIAPLDHSPY